MRSTGQCRGWSKSERRNAEHTDNCTQNTQTVPKNLGERHRALIAVLFPHAFVVSTCSVLFFLRALRSQCLGTILITIVEVWVYYIPSFVASPFFVPGLLIMSAVKFAVVVMFYMHLKYDHKLFRALFTGPLLIAVFTITALLFLFHQLSISL